MTGLTATERLPWDQLFAAVGRDPDDDHAWARLYASLWPYLLDWIVSRYGLDGSEASDALQNAWLQYRAKLVAGKIANPSLPHLRAFVKFCVLSLLREQSRLVSLDEITLPFAPGDLERELFNKLLVDEALDRMDRRCAYVLRAKYFHGQTSAEIALTLGLEAGHVRVLAHRCLEECRNLVLRLNDSASRTQVAS